MLQRSQTIFGAFNVDNRPFLIHWSVIDGRAPRRSGLHLGTVEYENALAVASPNRRDDEEL
jgi:hypothetical protein